MHQRLRSLVVSMLALAGPFNTMTIAHHYWSQFADNIRAARASW